MSKTAEILIAAFDGTRVNFFDVTEIKEHHLEKVIPHMTDREKAYLKKSKESGYNLAQQFVHAVCSTTTYRANQLLDRLAD